MDDLPLSIPANKLSDFLLCPICMCNMKSTVTTACGHRYCDGCITECLDLRHKCPLCNRQLTRDQLRKDPMFDDLIRTIEQEKEKSETNYFTTLVSTAGLKEEQCDNSHFSPVEKVLQKHMTKALITHEKYFQDLKRRSQRRANECEQEYERLCADLISHNLSPQDHEQQMEQLKINKEKQQENLTNELAACSQLVADAYDRYLSDHIPDLHVLPIRVTLNVLQKNTLIPNIEIQPSQSIEEIHAVLEAHLKMRGDEIVKCSDNTRYVCFRSFCKHSQYEMHQLAQDIVDHGATHPDIFILRPRCYPLLEHALKPGCTIALYGCVQFKSDLPKECFSSVFQLGQAYSVDYFSCKDCKFNWVCRSCMEVCHKDHNTVPYIINHHPTWACCYCPKKKKCYIN